MRSRFIWQRRAALWGSLAVNFYVMIADWVFQPLHGRGLFQPVLAQLNSLSWIASFPAYVIIAKVGIRGALSPPHRLSTSAWFIMWGISLVLWAVALRLFLRILFPPATVERAVETDATPDRVDDTPPDAPATMPVVITTRRRFLTNTARAAVACAALTGGYSMLLETRWFKITRRRHAIRGLRPELSGLRIVQLTDIHHGPALSLNYVREVVAATNALKPDLVLLTGDYVHRSPLYIDPVVRELAELKAKIGVVGVLGNHDWWESAPITRVCFSSAGIPLIDNDRMFVSPDRKLVRGGTDQGLCIAGVGDLIEDRILFDDALRDVPLEMPRLLLSHNPDVAEYPPLVAAARAGGASAATARIDLMLAGHTHGGQIWLPGLGTLVVPSRFGQKYASGLVQGPVCPVYISRGIGTTVLPLRFGVPPEIAVIELVPA